MSKKVFIQRHLDGVMGKAHNKRMRLLPTKNGNVIIEFSIMDGSSKQRIRHKLTHKGKVVNSSFMITRESVAMLYSGLHQVLLNFDSMVENSEIETK